MGSITRKVVILLLCGSGFALRRPFMDPFSQSASQLPISTGQSDIQYEYNTSYYPSMPIDHFDFSNTKVFTLKYLTNFKSYKSGGPIFFYAGNEGTIEGFAVATGIMFDLAPLFNAALVFAEHRYYGSSRPFGNYSESFKNVERMAYLNVQQALADFVEIIAYVKASILKCSADTPVIAFGGSYGGMLTTWFRMKYPHVINGAWSASAPVLPFHGSNLNEGGYYNVTTRTFVDSGCSRDAIAKSWDALRSLNGDLDFLNTLFHIDENSTLTSPDDVEYLVGFAREALEYMTMVDYPYPNGFLKPVPAWPVKVACGYLKDASGDAKTLATQLFNAISVYYNGTGQEATYCVKPDSCDDMATEALGTPLGWPWQACTEIIMEMCSKGGDNDFFEDDCGAYGAALQEDIAECNSTFASRGYTTSMLHEDAILYEFGLNFAATSNIIFTNGYLDPWSSGGITSETPGIAEARSNGVYVFELQGAGHHLDLRQPNTCDPPPVQNARFQIVNILKCWTDPKNCKKAPEQEALPQLGDLNSVNCSFVINGYPWGQASTSTSSTLRATFVTSVTVFFLLQTLLSAL